ncbi:hypothetical protein [Planktothrix sp. FACHB-1365]|uniref:hypothetical protein n=1 Tax=Planktothrix sp. FACHB-1365 TaxID=2692855 RepID=UPI0016844CCE|nr:hypothetical protein [Planktothrix sp. FACHB-1365]MBD2482757.1 hypothetical protein [Planktothrix sp. FACHB-1365]
MNLEMVLNELSLKNRADSIQEAQEWILNLVNTALLAIDISGMTKGVLRADQNSYTSLIADNYSILNWCADKSVDPTKRVFLLSSIKIPFEAEINNPDIQSKQLSSEFFYEEESSKGLGWAFLLDTLAVSLPSDGRWKNSHLKLVVEELDDSDNLISTTVDVIHASQISHVIGHTTWLQKRLELSVSSSEELWERKDELFPHLKFCDHVEQQIKTLLVGDPMFKQVKKKLFELEEAANNWKEGFFDYDNLPSKASPESESRLNKFEKELTFRCPDHTKKTFTLHLRMTPGDWRLYFFPSKLGQILIGYIGRKIQ